MCGGGLAAPPQRTLMQIQHVSVSSAQMLQLCNAPSHEIRFKAAALLLLLLLTVPSVKGKQPGKQPYLRRRSGHGTELSHRRRGLPQITLRLYLLAQVSIPECSGFRAEPAAA